MKHGIALDVTLPLDRFSLSVSWETAESALGIFGPSGAGKTALLEVLAGLRPEARGVIRVEGLTWLDSAQFRAIPPEDRGIGYVPQEGLLFPHRDVMGNLLAGRRRAARDPRAGATMQKVIEVLELGDLLSRDVRALSGGERRRVALGRALCSGPSLLLLDEPLANLDLPLRRRIMSYLWRVQREFDIPALFVSHDATEIKTLCREVLVLHAGQAIARGRPDEVFANPAILPLAPGDGVDNLLQGAVTATQGRSATIELEPGLTIAVAAADLRAGEEAILGVRGEELILATRPPAGLSAQNSLPGTIDALQPLTEDASPGQLLVKVLVGRLERPLVVTITSDASRRLELRPGLPVFLICKAHSFRVLATRSKGTLP